MAKETFLTRKKWNSGISGRKKGHSKEKNG